MFCDLAHLTPTNVPVSQVKYPKNISLKKLFCNAHRRKEGGKEGETKREREHLSV